MVEQDTGGTVVTGSSRPTSTTSQYGNVSGFDDLSEGTGPATFFEEQVQLAPTSSLDHPNGYITGVGTVYNFPFMQQDIGMASLEEGYSNTSRSLHYVHSGHSNLGDLTGLDNASADDTDFAHAVVFHNQ